MINSGIFEYNSLGKYTMPLPAWEPTPEILEEIKGWAAIGMTQEQIADNLGIASETLSRKKKDYYQIDQALKKGAFTGGTHIANALFNNATVHNNVTAQIFYLKAKCGWMEASEKKKIEQQNNVQNDIKDAQETAQKKMENKCKEPKS
jgi:transcriptional regulator with XRE-family HTH domain